MREIPTALRPADLIAKAARVTLRDTLRVLAALDAVAYLYDVEPSVVVEDLCYDANRPAPENVAACEQEFFALRDRNEENAEQISTRLALIQDLM